MTMAKDSMYLLLILLILAIIYLGWKVEERKKVKTAKNTKNGVKEDNLVVGKMIDLLKVGMAQSQ